MINHRSPNLHYRGWTNTRAFQAGYPGIGSSREYTQSIKIEATKLPIIFGSLEFSVVGGNPILFSIFFFFFFFRNVDELSEHLSTGALDPCQRERDRNDIANYACSNFISIFRSRRSRNDGGSTTNVCTVVFRDSSAGRLKKKKMIRFSRCDAASDNNHRAHLLGLPISLPSPSVYRNPCSTISLPVNDTSLRRYVTHPPRSRRQFSFHRNARRWENWN